MLPETGFSVRENAFARNSEDFHLSWLGFGFGLGSGWFALARLGLPWLGLPLALALALVQFVSGVKWSKSKIFLPKLDKQFLSFL